MKRKVLIVASWFPSDLSPHSGVFIQEQAQVLKETFDVHVLVPMITGWRQLIRGEHGLKSEIELRDNLTVYRERGLVLMPRLLSSIYNAYLKAAENFLQT